MVSDLTIFEQKDANFADFLAFFIIKIFYTIENKQTFSTLNQQCAVLTFASSAPRFMDYQHDWFVSASKKANVRKISVTSQINFYTKNFNITR